MGSKPKRRMKDLIAALQAAIGEIGLQQEEIKKKLNKLDDFVRKEIAPRVNEAGIK